MKKNITAGIIYGRKKDITVGQTTDTSCGKTKDGESAGFYDVETGD